MRVEKPENKTSEKKNDKEKSRLSPEFLPDPSSWTLCARMAQATTNDCRATVPPTAPVHTSHILETPGNSSEAAHHTPVTHRSFKAHRRGMFACGRETGSKGELIGKDFSHTYLVGNGIALEV